MNALSGNRVVSIAVSTLKAPTDVNAIQVTKWTKGYVLVSVYIEQSFLSRC